MFAKRLLRADKPNLMKLTNIYSQLQHARQLGLSYRGAVVVLVLNFASIAFEGIGVAMLLPIFEFIEAGGDLSQLAARGRHWAFLIDASQRFGFSIDLSILLLVSFSAIVCRQLFTFWRTRYSARVLFQSIHRLRERTFGLFLMTRTAQQQESLLGEAVNDVAIELPKSIHAIYGTVDLLSRFILAAVYLFGLFLLSGLMALVSLSIVMALAGRL